MNGIICDHCKQKIESNEEMITISKHRLEDCLVMHSVCFFKPLAEKLTIRIEQTLRENREAVIFSLFPLKSK